MQLTAVATFVALALGVAAVPQAPEIHEVSNQPSGGHKACCLSSNDIHADGIASGLLTEGILVPLLGSKDQACAKWELIENLNLLGFTKQDQNGSGCSGTPAHCDDQGCHPDH